MKQKFMDQARAKLLEIPDEIWAAAGGDPDERAPINLRTLEFRACGMCASGEYQGKDFICFRLGGPRWKLGAEMEHTCDLWRKVEGEEVEEG